MDDIYREIILDHFKNPRNFGKMGSPDMSAFENNPFCGDKIEMQIKFQPKADRPLDEKVIKDIKFRGEGCAISMASASMLTEKVMGQDVAEIKKLDTEDILKMLGITLSPTRLKCALLPLEVLQKAISR